MLNTAIFFFPEYENIQFLDTPTSQEFNVDEDAMVRCIVDGTPTPRVTWSHRGRKILTGSPFREFYID
jgi:hypothetical protein